MELGYYFIFAVVLIGGIYWLIGFLDRKQAEQNKREQERIEKLNLKYRESLRKHREEKKKKLDDVE